MSRETTPVGAGIEYLADLLLLLVLFAVPIRYLEYVSESLRWLIIVFLTALPPSSLVVALLISNLNRVDICKAIEVGTSLRRVHHATLSKGLQTIEKADAPVFIQFEAGSR